MNLLEELEKYIEYKRNHPESEGNNNVSNNFNQQQSINQNSMAQSVLNSVYNPQQQQKQQEPSIWEKMNYLGKNLKTGAEQGTVGIGQAALTDAANEMKKGQDKDVGKIIANTVNSFVNPTSNLVNGTVDTIKNNIDTIQDNDKNLWEKLMSIATNTVSGSSKALMSGYSTFSSINQLAGKVVPNAGNATLELNQKISEPIEKKQQELAEEAEKHDEATKFLGEVSNAIGNMGPSIATSIATKDPSKALGIMGLSAKGQSTQDALNKGANLDEAIKIGDTKALVEVGTEKMTGGVKMFGGGNTAEQALRNQIKNKVGNKVLQKIANTGLDIAGEGLEETISDIVDTAIDRGSIDKNASYSLEDWGKTQGVTALTTLALNALGVGANGIGKKLRGQSYIDTNTGQKLDKNIQNVLNQAENIIKQNNTDSQQITQPQVQNTSQDNLTTNNNTQTMQDLTERVNKSNLPQETKQSMLEDIDKGINQEQYNKMRELIDNSVANNQNVLYNNIKIGETKNINIDDVANLIDQGGYRTEEQINNLRNDIKENGITTPIEIYRKNDGTIAIENGHHRLQIAKELGIKDIPVKMVESWENIGLKNISEESKEKVEGVYNNENDKVGEEFNIINEASRDSERGLYNNNEQSQNFGTTRENVNIPTKESNSNEQTSSNGSKANNRKQLENSNQSSINLPVNNTQDNIQAPINKVPTQGEPVNWNEMEKPEGKIRKHYKSIIESSNTTAEAKAVAKELIGSDTYVPESNKQHLAEADRRIQENGADDELKTLTSMSNRIDAKITANDIAVGERLIEYYSKIGDKAKLQEAIQTTAMAGTQAGRTVQALSLLNHQTPQGQVTWIQRSVNKMNQELINKRGKNAEQFDFTPEMQQKIMESNNQEEMNQAINEVYKELGQQVSKSRIGQIDSWRYFSMLANPKTHIRNIVGNIAMGKTQSVKNKVAGAIEGAVAKFNPNMERTHTLKPASKEVKQFAKSDISNIADRLELNQNKYNPKSRLESSMRTFKSDTMENTLGKLFELNEKALEAEDAWGLKSGYVKALSEYMTANNLTPDTITDTQLAKARNYAVKEAKEATFHAENAIATAINQFSKKNKLTSFTTKAVLPFVKTPMNIAKAGLEYNPTGLIKTLTLDNVKLRKGNITVNQYIDNLSKGLTGTGIAVLGYAMAEAGILKASGGDDDKKEKFDEALGKQSYSLQIGDKTYSLDWLAPAGIPLFVGAEANAIDKVNKDEKSSKSSDDDKKSKQVIESLENWANAMTNSMSPMAEMSMISGLTSALKSYNQDSTQMIGQIGTNALKSYVNQFVPTALGQVAKTADEYERNTTSTKTGILPKVIDQTKLQVMSKIPGLRQQLPIKTDIWGKEQNQEGNVVEKAFKNAIVPFAIKDVYNDKVDTELNNLYNKTGESSILPANSLDKTFTIDGQQYRMTNEEYSKYKESYGKNSFELLEGLISSTDYKNLTNEQKQKAIENIYSYAKEANKIDYAKQNHLSVESSSLYNTMEELKKNKGNQSSYLNYLSKTIGLDKESEKNEVLANANYDKNTKAIIYKNSTGKQDEFYNIVGKNINITEYLKYKVANSGEELKADKDSNGNSINGTSKEKKYNYVNNNISKYEDRLLLLGNEYKLTNYERQQLANYINTLDNSMEIYKKLTKNYIVKDGIAYYK